MSLCLSGPSTEGEACFVMSYDKVLGVGSMSNSRCKLDLQWNLHNTDNVGTPSNCPYYRGVLSSEVGS